MEKFNEFFLKKSWCDLAKNQNGIETENNRDYKIFDKISKESIADEDLRELFEMLETQMFRYVESIATRLKTKSESLNIKDSEIANEVQRRSHEALIDKLNILSRAFSQKKLDNKWRDDIGLDRKDITRWAVNVVENLKTEMEESI